MDELRRLFPALGDAAAQKSIVRAAMDRRASSGVNLS
jgi:hypothetical protein